MRLLDFKVNTLDTVGTAQNLNTAQEWAKVVQHTLGLLQQSLQPRTSGTALLLYTVRRWANLLCCYSANLLYCNNKCQSCSLSRDMLIVHIVSQLP